MLNYNESYNKNYTNTVSVKINNKKEKVNYIKLKEIDMQGMSDEQFIETYVSGKTTLEAVKDTENNSEVLNILGQLFKVDSEVEEKDLRKAKGLIKLEDDSYLLIMRNKAFILIIWFLVLLLLLLIGTIMIGKLTSFDNTDTDKDTGKDLEQFAIADSKDGDQLDLYTPETDFGQNTIIAYKDAYVNSEYRTIPLINPSENTNYAQFIIYDSEGKDLYTSDLVKPNSQIDYDIYSVYNKPGEYTIGMRVIFYEPTYENDDVIGFTPCTVQINNGDIIIKVQ